MSSKARTPGRSTIGVISDTHGSLDPRVAEALAGVERIVHAGDIGRPDVLWELETIAPVTAVLGNVDSRDSLAQNLTPLAGLVVGGNRIVVVHDRADLPRHEAEASDVVIYGHSHMPLVKRESGVLWVNPGSATQPRRSAIGRSVALLEIEEDGSAEARIVALAQIGEW